MSDLVRQEIATTSHTIVVKIGTRVLTNQDATLDEAQIQRLVEDIHHLLDAGRRVVLVSSGAVGAGLSQLGMTARPTDLAKLQAVAAVGQAKLTECYDRHLKVYNRHAAQVLLTSDVLNDRDRYLNVRNTLFSLLDMGAVPIINENDTVAVDELMLSFGDNDRLAAMVTNLLRAPLLVLLSDVDGLYDGDPSSSGSKRIELVPQIDDKILGLAEDCQFGLSKGGMASKLQAARMATTAGENVIIASGKQASVLKDILAGKAVGTLFLATGKSISPWKRWIGFSAQPAGQLGLDDGAATAIVRQGRSLLAVGVRSVAGTFLKGDIVALVDLSGKELARGLTNYSAEQMSRIRGLHSQQIAEKLGHCPYDEVVHRDNLAITATS